ncbi:MAG: FKBP-type peptidyl-prolyl cis-trans isomerase [Marinoscillum sp.]
MRNLWILILALAVVACAENNDFVTESGVEVSCLVKGDGEIFVKDSVVLLNMKIQTADGEVLTESTPLEPLALAYDPEMEAGHIQEVLNGMQVGDSVYFETTALNLFVETYKTRIPPQMDSTTVITVNMKVTEQMSQESYRAYLTEVRTKKMAKDAELLEEKAVSDVREIDAYLEKEGIEAQTTESGLRYVITKEGTGATAEPGDVVKVHYEGRILDGPYFDTSVEEVAKREGLYDPRRDPYDPFEFPIGQGRVIKGWDEGIALIKEGGKGTLYIPSPLAYGSREAGEVIKPFSILVFDVEVIEVSKN